MAERDIHDINLRWFDEHRAELCDKYENKSLLIHDSKLIDVFDDGLEAMDKGRRLFGEDNFTVTPCRREMLCVYSPFFVFDSNVDAVVTPEG